jgi:hypothetical protein
MTNVLKVVLDRARNVNLKLSADKCEIWRSELTYVGHTFTDAGLKPDPEKSRAVQEMKRPEKCKELANILGFVRYFEKFMPTLSKIGSPLHKVTD